MFAAARHAACIRPAGATSAWSTVPLPTQLPHPRTSSAALPEKSSGASRCRNLARKGTESGKAAMAERYTTPATAPLSTAATAAADSSPSSSSPAQRGRGGGWGWGQGTDKAGRGGDAGNRQWQQRWCRQLQAEQGYLTHQGICASTSSRFATSTATSTPCARPAALTCHVGVGVGDAQHAAALAQAQRVQQLQPGGAAGGSGRACRGNSQTTLPWTFAALRLQCTCACSQAACQANHERGWGQGAPPFPSTATSHLSHSSAHPPCPPEVLVPQLWRVLAHAQAALHERARRRRVLVGLELPGRRVRPQGGAPRVQLQRLGEHLGHLAAAAGGLAEAQPAGPEVQVAPAAAQGGGGLEWALRKVG